MDSYEKCLDRANIARDFEVTSGACITIALAMDEVFEESEIVAVSSRKSVQTIEHAVVKIDNNLYDGRGKVCKDRLIREFSKSSPSPENRKHLFWSPTKKQLAKHKGGELYENVKEKLENNF